MLSRYLCKYTGKQESYLPKLDDNFPNNSLKIAFGILSSKESEQAIDDIAGAVFPHPVYVHHDFSKQPNFSPIAPNIHILQQPVVTAWGDFSLVEASFLLMKEALKDINVTHFQLLSESCLPVRPIHEFEAYLSKEHPDVMIDMYSLENEDAMFSHGWRYLQHRYLFNKLLEKACWWGSGRRIAAYRTTCSINLRIPQQDSIKDQILEAVGKRVVHLFFKSTNKMLAKDNLQQIAIGGQWFGASRRGVNWLLNMRNHCDTFTQHYQRCTIPDESYLHTFVYNGQLAGLPLRVYPSNHLVSWMDCKTGPDTLKEQDIKRTLDSEKFFSRKFSLSTDDYTRRYFIRMLLKNNPS